MKGKLSILAGLRARLSSHFTKLLQSNAWRQTLTIIANYSTFSLSVCTLHIAAFIQVNVLIILSFLVPFNMPLFVSLVLFRVFPLYVKDYNAPFYVVSESMPVTG